MGILEFAATSLTLLSVYFMTSEAYLKGWIIGFFGNISWVCLGVSIGSNGLIAVNLVMGVLYLKAILNHYGERNYV